jgi:hypothetical protein
MGKPVLCAGKARYTQVPTVFFPKSKDEFCNTLEKFIKSEKIEIPAEFVSNSRKVLYSQLFLASLSFSDFLEDENLWKGYVKIKNFKPQALKAQNSPAIATICAASNRRSSSYTDHETALFTCHSGL